MRLKFAANRRIMELKSNFSKGGSEYSEISQMLEEEAIAMNLYEVPEPFDDEELPEPFLKQETNLIDDEDVAEDSPAESAEASAPEALPVATASTPSSAAPEAKAAAKSKRGSKGKGIGAGKGDKDDEKIVKLTKKIDKYTKLMGHSLVSEKKISECASKRKRAYEALAEAINEPAFVYSVELPDHLSSYNEYVSRLMTEKKGIVNLVDLEEVDAKDKNAVAIECLKYRVSKHGEVWKRCFV